MGKATEEPCALCDGDGLVADLEDLNRAAASIAPSIDVLARMRPEERL